MKKQDFLTQIKPYLIHNELLTYCELLKAYYSDEDFTNSITLLEQRINTHQKDLDKGTILPAEYNKERTKISEALLNLAQNTISDDYESEISENLKQKIANTLVTPQTPAFDTNQTSFFLRFFKNIKTGDWNWFNISSLVVALASLIVGYLALGNDKEKMPTTENKSIAQADTFKAAFPKKYLKDTLFVLVTRFEDFIATHETECVGKAILLRVKNLRDLQKLPIRAYYAENISIDGEREADELRNKHHADLIIYGRVKNMKQNCGVGELCFKCEPSDAIILAAGGQVKKNELDYQKNISPEMMEMGEITIKGKRFDDWLTANFNAKVGRYNPDWYQISENLPKEELFAEYKIRRALFFKNKKYEKAILDFDRCIELKPNDAESYFYRGFAKERLKQYETAVQDYNKAIELNPYDAKMYNNRGFVSISLNKYEEAIQDFNKAIELAPNNKEAYINRGSAKSVLAKHKSAVQDYDKAILLDSNFETAYFNRGNANMMLNQYKAAIQDYDRAIKLDNKDEMFYVNRAVAKHHLSQYEQAVQDYNKAIKLNTKNSMLYFNRGLDEGYLGQYEPAIQDFSKAIELKPTYADAYSNRGVAKIKLDLYEEAIRDFSKAIELNPNDRNAQNHKKKALQEMQKQQSKKKFPYGIMVFILVGLGAYFFYQRRKTTKTQVKAQKHQKQGNKNTRKR